MNITFSRISFGIRTFATVNFSLKRSVSSWALPREKSRSPAFFWSRHFKCWHSNVRPSASLQPHKQFRLSLRSTDWKRTNKTFCEKCGTIEAKIEGEGYWLFWVYEYATHNEWLWFKAQISSITYLSCCVTWTLAFPSIWLPLCFIKILYSK